MKIVVVPEEPTILVFEKSFSELMALLDFNAITTGVKLSERSTIGFQPWATNWEPIKELVYNISKLPFNPSSATVLRENDKIFVKPYK